MDLTSCKLYGIKRKRDLFFLLKINDRKELKQIVNMYNPYIANKGKKRLIEPIVSNKLKKVQKTIQILLKDIEFDENVFSGISGKSYIDNGRYHIGCKYIVALDISKFFPNTHREKVYKFFKENLLNSSDVAKILTDLCCVDVCKIKDCKQDVIQYIKDNNIKTKNHIPTGSSISCILSYLVNYDMFKKINRILEKNGYKVSIYVDDIVISSNKKINKQLIYKIIKEIRFSGYKIQKSKLKYYGDKEFKRVTGNIISKDGTKLIVPNKIRYKMLKVRKNKELTDDKAKNKLRGYNQVIKQIEDSNK